MKEENKMSMYYEISLEFLESQAPDLSVDDNDPLTILINRELEALANRYGYDSIEEFLLNNIGTTFN